MYKDEAEKLLLALDGIAANVETLRAVISMSIEATPPSIVSNLVIDPNQECTHPELRPIDTMGGTKTYCFECGYAE